MSLSVTVAMGGLPLLDGAEGEAADELALAQPAEDQDGGDGDRRGGRQLRPEQALRRREGGDEGGERGGVRDREVQAPERLVPAQDYREQGRGGDAGQRERHQQ